MTHPISIQLQIYSADVSAHTVGPGKTKFGSVAAELWSRHMQWAEGPSAFEQGYQYLCDLYAHDPHKLRYLQELYDSPERHNFGAVKTYVCVRYRRLPMTPCFRVLSPCMSVFTTIGLHVSVQCLHK